MRFWDKKNIIIILLSAAVTVTCLGVMAKTDLPIGMYIVNGYGIVTAAVYGWVFLWGGRNISEKRQEVYPLVLNGLGLTSVLFYMSRQFHTQFVDNGAFAFHLISGGAALYLEMLVFVMFFCLWGRKKEGN